MVEDLTIKERRFSVVMYVVGSWHRKLLPPPIVFFIDLHTSHE